MKCRPGDMAILSAGSDAGHAVTCIRVEDPPSPFHIAGNYGPIWLLDKPVTWRHVFAFMESEKVPYWPDRFLQPIRPDELPDEEKFAGVKDVHIPTSLVDV
jgi:hypothetical protein